MVLWIHQILWILTGIYFSAAAWADRRSKTIPVKLAGSFGAAACVGRLVLFLFQKNLDIPDFLLSLLPGAVVLMFGLATRQAAGYGDGLSLLFGGIALGASSICAIALTGFALCAIWGMGEMILKKTSAKEKLAFLPFLAIGYYLELGGILLEMI